MKLLRKRKTRDLSCVKCIIKMKIEESYFDKLLIESHAGKWREPSICDKPCFPCKLMHLILTPEACMRFVVAGYDEYMQFLCGINGSAAVVLNYTGQNCWVYNSTISGADLNLPSITIAKLNQSKTIQRSVTNIGGNETYSVGWSAPYGVSVKVIPAHFSIGSGERQVLSVYLNATVSTSVASFGRIGLFGNQGHILNLPLSVLVKISYNNTPNA
jgi:hypothetical protein